MQPIGRIGYVPHTPYFWTLWPNNHTQPASAVLMASTPVIHVITWITTHLPTQKGWKGDLAWLVDLYSRHYPIIIILLAKKRRKYDLDKRRQTSTCLGLPGGGRHATWSMASEAEIPAMSWSAGRRSLLVVVRLNAVLTPRRSVDLEQRSSTVTAHHITSGRRYTVTPAGKRLLTG